MRRAGVDWCACLRPSLLAVVSGRQARQAAVRIDREGEGNAAFELEAYLVVLNRIRSRLFPSKEDGADLLVVVEDERVLAVVGPIGAADVMIRRIAAVSACGTDEGQKYCEAVHDLE